MTAPQESAPGRPPWRWARIRAEYHRDYPATYQGQWLRVVRPPNPDLPTLPGRFWVEFGDKAHLVQAEHCEMVERTTQRILVVDDDPSIVRTLQAALRVAGYDVTPARNGEEAIRLWRELGPDLVITDIHMPEKSGLLLLEDLQAGRSFARVIVMTDGGPAHKFNLLGLAQMLGAVKTIAKPFSLDAMVRLVKAELTAQSL